jgi:hypothetical protein
MIDALITGKLIHDRVLKPARQDDYENRTHATPLFTRTDCANGTAKAYERN